MSFAGKVIQQQGGGIRFVRATEQEKSCWFYVRIDDDKIGSYKRALKSDPLNLADYGAILKSGWGEMPSRNTQRYIHKRYGYITPEGDKA